jgi:hypothetical protein
MRRIALLLLALTPFCATAQMIDLQPGSRVRVSSPGLIAGRIEGLVAQRTADSIVIVTSQPATYRIAVGSATSISRSLGKSRSRGALKGALWGGPIMLVLSATMTGDTELRRNYDGSVMPVSSFLAMETLGGAGIGALIGALIGSEQWASYETPARITVGHNSARVGASFSF